MSLSWGMDKQYAMSIKWKKKKTESTIGKDNNIEGS